MGKDGIQSWGRESGSVSRGVLAVFLLRGNQFSQQASKKQTF